VEKITSYNAVSAWISGHVLTPAVVRSRYYMYMLCLGRDVSRKGVGTLTELKFYVPLDTK